MSFNLFDVAKVPVTLDKMEHALEKRPDGETRVVILTLRMQPFDAKWASGFHAEVKRTLFSMNTAEPNGHLARVNFALGVPRQHIDCYASSDTRDASRRLEFGKISGIYARTEKGTTGYALVWKVTFGPASDKELAFCEGWLGTMKFLTFEESEPNAALDMIDDEAEDDDEDEQPALPDHEFDTDAGGSPKDGSEGVEPARPPRPRHTDPQARAKAKQQGARGKGRR